MDNTTRQKVDGIVTDLDHLIKELRILSSNISKDFEGLGEESCSSSIESMANGYECIKNQLSEIN
ncbi:MULTISPECIES: hypothetical protein [Clostridium]|uniref:hypothetical protein n=1 Tax=Clostridium TaxID=1485 RepID=UPI00069D1E00|nr:MULTISPECIES: hypothetical protein [Clostridium]KOF57072.1 hypothetical protein AGR56_11000 [Clostridium sp. DMHC 10]MCD2348941.1 hypothetical protein [Clostridium guangxiense]